MTKSRLKRGDERLRVLRIAHSSLTPALRERERALARCYPDIDLEVLTTQRWREAEVDVEVAPDDLFPVVSARACLSRHIQLFAYDPRPVIAALCRHRPHIIDLNHEPYSVAGAEVLTLASWFAPQASIVMQTAQNILRRYPPPFNWLERRAFRRVSAAYACSETVVEVLRAKGFTKPAPIIPFGVDVDAFNCRDQNRISNGPLTIGFAGRMLPGKGLDVLAQALVQLKNENWNLLIVGDGPERKAFEETLRAHDLHARARFTGAVSYESVPKFFQEMDLMVMPTRTTSRIREQFGRVLVEAMASGVPVVGSTCGAIPEVIDEAGLVVAEGNADELATAVRRLLTDEPLRKRLVSAGRRRVEENYSWEKVADKTYELFQHVLRTNESRGLNRKLELAA